MGAFPSIRSLIPLMALAVASTGPASAAPTAHPVRNIVLVHGAWADGAGWKGVYDILKRDGYRVSAVTHSNESLASDVAETKRVLDRQDGPVILVGHSYGGAIISEAGDDPKVVGLVYIAAFVPDVGESALGMYPKGTPPHPVESTADGMTYFKHDAYLAAFAPEVPRDQLEFMAASQVPFSLEKAGLAPLAKAAWRTKPSWYLLSKDDMLVPPPLARMMATRAKATIVEVPGSHAVFVARPAAAVRLIEKAAAR